MLKKKNNAKIGLLWSGTKKKNLALKVPLFKVGFFCLFVYLYYFADNIKRSEFSGTENKQEIEKVKKQ